MNIEKYLKESNAIEGVYSRKALEEAMEAWEYLKKQDELTHGIVLKTHAILMENRELEQKWKGNYRDIQVYIGDHTPPKPREVHDLMDNLLHDIPEDKMKALEWHVQFEKIHPFADGNGRIGRLLYLWHCKELLGEEPLMFTEKHRRAYYRLFDDDVNMDLIALIIEEKDVLDKLT